MLRKKILAAAVAAGFVVSASVLAADDAEIKKVREEIETIKDDYETRVRQLEQRLEKAEQSAGTAKPATRAQSAPASANAFNPAISLILGSQFNNLQLDPETYQIGGFIPGGDEIGPGNRSFNLGESELTVSANVDPYFSGFFVMAVTPENEVEVEEGYIQNSGFVPGVTVKFGRFLSGFGYLNETHAHAWDFVDAPLVHQAFFGGQLKEEGLQARWLAPTPVFLEFGLETGRGANFPGSERNKNGVNSGMVFAHVGDDVGISNSYRFGASYRVTHAQDRPYDDLDSLGNAVINAFTGDSKMWGLDFVWKWAPNGNTVDRNFKFQAEYMHREEDGSLTFDEDGAVGGPLSNSYKSKQSGWYLQGAYQFMARWRVGLRYEELDSGIPDIGLVNSAVLSAADFPRIAQNDPKRTTAMIDFSPSEFSRFRLQFARDEARFNEADNQVFLQYIMSLGTHGAHKF
ncbi:MAG TPA: hypothetical protein VJT81_03255 [Burkholderiales bacterium]|nr:hypothetical protein [Burkholderiales bacterium]